MSDKSGHCQYYYGDMVLDTCPDTRLALPLRRRWWTLKRFVWYASFVGPVGAMSRWLYASRLGKLVPKGKSTVRSGLLGLKAGDLVEVRSAKEIFATLDERGKLRGLSFTSEMMKFCGGRFRVYKKLDKIILEATGELRTMRRPTVILEGVFCDGKAHGGCNRSCFCFWREQWLKKVSD